ncbi:hypothetical protein M885DRAFT_546883 [Pelagophyceae sp. CCMP2097]|nr:hypothetical protein M885DRAFT_546883 [Pelagophyceae sp. CCMP2097]
MASFAEEPVVVVRGGGSAALIVAVLRYNVAATPEADCADCLLVSATSYTPSRRIRFEPGGDAARGGGVVLCCDSVAAVEAAQLEGDAEASLKVVASVATDFDADLAGWCVDHGFEYIFAVDCARPLDGADERDKEGVPRVVEALREATWDCAGEPDRDADELAPAIAVVGPRSAFVAHALTGSHAGVSAYAVTKKYYSTEVVVLAAASFDHPMWARVEALILTAAAADTEDEIESLDAARVKAEDRAPKLSTRLVVCGRSTPLLLAWAVNHNFEVVQLDDGAAPPGDDAVREKVGTARIAEALEATLWSGCRDSADEAPDASTDEDAEPAAGEDSEPAAGGEEPGDEEPADKADEQCGDEAGVGPQASLDFEEMMRAVGDARAAAAALPDAQRRANAADVALRLMAQFGLDDSSDED